MKQLTLCLAFHNHQPVGNFSWVFADAYRTAYFPMLECLERHPAVRVSLHYTGPLIDWIRQNEPEFLTRLAALVRRGQVELLTGGYYEPILPAIPHADRIGQIRKMTDLIRQDFGAEPTGLWLAERVWEPQLPTDLREAGVEWTIVDDAHFKMSGLDEADLTGYFLTEDQGNWLKVFATSKRLRYILPWKKAEEIISELAGIASSDPSLVLVMGDDGEKFGVWPGTNELCWKNGWMDRFFSLLEEQSRWLRVMPTGEYAKQFPARGRVYLPTASYSEMMEWALPAEAAEQFHNVYHELEAAHRDDVVRFLRGGFWRNFLAKYDEVNTMHKKMLRVHRKVYATGTVGGQPDEVALDELWQAQCNCPYWHGVFGGVYMTDVRTSTFQHLIQAEHRAESLKQRPGDWLDHEFTDFDYDSHDELVVETSRANYYFAPASGGTLFEWDVREPAHNLVSVLTRRPEAYHSTLRRAAEMTSGGDVGEAKTIHELVILKEKGLEKRLFYDWYRRACLVDHFLQNGTTPAAFAACVYGEAGDFVNQPYEVSAVADDEGLIVTFQRDGHVWDGPEFRPVQIVKKVRVAANAAGLIVNYQITNPSDRPLTATFGTEFNLNLLGGGGNPAAFSRFDGRTSRTQRFNVDWATTEARQVVCGNEHLGIEVGFEPSQPSNAWWSSIESISSSEGGFERIHQGASLLFSWPIEIGSGSSWTVSVVARSSDKG